MQSPITVTLLLSTGGNQDSATCPVEPTSWFHDSLSSGHRLMVDSVGHLRSAKLMINTFPVCIPLFVSGKPIGGWGWEDVPHRMVEREPLF